MFGAAEPRIDPLVPAQAAQVQRLREALDPGALRDEVESLAVPRNRFNAPEAMTKVEAHVVAAFRSAGWEAGRESFDVQDNESWHGVNLVARKPGTSSTDTVIVAAHHDTVPGSPGADDNTAGVVGLLALARLLARSRFERSVVLVSFDMEETGFHGSRAFVRRFAREHRVVGAFVFETMAYTDPRPGSQKLPEGVDRVYKDQVARIRARQHRGDWTTVIFRKQDRHLAVPFARALAHLAGRDAVMLVRDPADLSLLGPALRRWAPFAVDFVRSDHTSFWQAGLPAVQITDTADYRNPHYHRPSDTPETLDYPRLADIVAATGMAVGTVAKNG